MPKSKPDMVHSVRIELQEKERELLEKYMEAKTVEGYAKAVNNAMIPVGVVFIGGGGGIMTPPMRLEMSIPGPCISY